MHGCHRAPDDPTRARRWALVEVLLEPLPVLPFGLPEARRHAERWTVLQEKGELIGPHEMQVGVTAHAQGWGVASLNHRAFIRIPGLILTDGAGFAR